MKKELYYFCFFMLLFVEFGFCQNSYNNDRSQYDTEIDKIMEENKNALDAITNSINLIKKATDFPETTEEIDKFFDNLCYQITLTLKGIDDQSELMSYIKKLKLKIRQKVEIYKGKEEQTFWIESDKTLTEKEKEIHDGRLQIQEVLGEIVKTKFEIYKELEKTSIENAVKSLDQITDSLQKLRETLTKVKDIPNTINSTAPK